MSTGVRVTLLIVSLDRVLGIRARAQGDFTAGLIADACAIVERVRPESLQEFYLWLTDNMGNPVMPETTEQILTDWDRVFGLQTKL